MSAISEVDIRDWQSIQLGPVKQAVNKLWHVDDVNLNDLQMIEKFFQQVELIRNRQLQAIPALFRRSD